MNDFGVTIYEACDYLNSMAFVSRQLTEMKLSDFVVNLNLLFVKSGKQIVGMAWQNNNLIRCSKNGINPIWYATVFVVEPTSKENS